MALLSPPIHSSPQSYFSGEGVQNRLLELIQASRTSIDLALFEFSSPRLAEALRRAQRRGVAIRLILDAHSGKKGADLSVLAGLEIREMAGRHAKEGLMHNKFAVFDGRCVSTGSYNWTRSAEHSNYENILVEDDPGVVRDYLRQFTLLWNLSHQKRIDNTGISRNVLVSMPRFFGSRRFARRRKL